MRAGPRPASTRASVWWDLPRRPGLEPAPPASGVLRCRTAIIGSGIAGLSLALSLDPARDDIVLLDRDHPAAGATGRNAGFVLADSDCFGLAERRYGTLGALMVHVVGVSTVSFYQSLAATGGRHAAGLRRSLSFPGSLRLASDRVEAAAFARSAEVLASSGLHTVPPMQPEGGSGKLGWRLGLVDPADGMVDPLILVDALLRALGDKVRRHDATEVTGVRMRPRAVEVRTRAGALVRADRVIVCTNADARRLVPAAVPRARPVRAQALAAWVDPAPPWTRPTYANRGGDYWRPLPDGRVLLGGLRRLARRAENTSATDATFVIQRSLDEFLRGLVGRDARVEVTHRWGGTMGFTADGLPVAGKVPGSPRVHVLAGCNGHGMGWAPGLALQLAAFLQGEGPPLPKLFRPGRA